MNDNPKTTGSAKLINAGELAEILNISERTIWRLIASGKLIQPIRIGKSVRWRLDEVNQWIESGCPENESVANGISL